jgi:hypothetical protein
MINTLFPLFSTFRYAKVNEVMTRCSVGTELMPIGEEPASLGFERTFAFTGQMGPVYAFSDALSSEQIRGIYNLGPSYMYSFLGDQNLLMNDDLLYKAILDARDGISSKMIFGLNAQVGVSSKHDILFLFNQTLKLDDCTFNHFLLSRPVTIGPCLMCHLYWIILTRVSLRQPPWVGQNYAHGACCRT